MWTEDSASKGLGMQLISVEPGRAVLAMTMTDKMVNGHNIAHGGYIFTLADSAFAFACNTYNQRTRGAALRGDFRQSRQAGRPADRARASSSQRAGRSGIYDITVTREDGTVIAEFRGHSRTIEGKILSGGNGIEADHGRRILQALRPRADRNRLARRDRGVADAAARMVAASTPTTMSRPIRKKFDAAGVTPSDFKRLEDIAKFPFTTKADLRDNYPFGMFAVPQDRIVRIHASSGTTGKPTVVGYTQKDIDNWADLMARSIRASGGRPGMKVHVAYGYGLFTGGLGAHYGAEKLGCAVIPVSGGMTERQVQLITDFKPDIIMVTPSYMLAILDEFRAKGSRSARLLAVDRHFRRRALDQPDARARSRRRSRWMRSTSTGCRK